MTFEISTLYAKETAATILARGLEVAKGLKLPVDSWRTGDPTRSLYAFLAEVLSLREEIDTTFIKAAFRSLWDDSVKEWAKQHALELYGVTAVEATYATPTATLTNAGSNYYSIESPGDLVLKNSTTGKTFSNTSLGTLAPGETRTFNMIADGVGTDYNSSTDEIDAFVTTYLGVTIDSSTAATATDEESLDSLDDRCGDTLGALSPSGPPDAYEYVALNTDLTGVVDVTRALAVGDNATGDVTLYLGGATANPAAGSITAVQDAIDIWATPLCITATAQAGTAVSTDVTVTVSGGIEPGETAAAQTAIEDYLATLGISDGTLTIYASRIIALAHGAATFDDVTTTFVDTTLAEGEYPVVGTVSVGGS